MHFRQDKSWQTRVEAEIMTTLGLKYAETGFNGKRFVKIPCVAQMIPRARSGIIKLVMSRGGPHHNRCLQEEGCGVHNKNEWNPKFITTWDAKEGSMRSTRHRERQGRCVNDLRNDNDNTIAGRIEGANDVVGGNGESLNIVGEQDGGGNVDRGGKSMSRNFCSRPAPNGQLVVFRRCI